MNGKLASRGGKARAAKLSKAELSAIGSRGAAARWARQPDQPAKDTVLYIRADQQLRALVEEHLEVQRRARPGESLTISDVVRAILYERLKPAP